MVSNPEQHVYFIREGDQLYDGDVEKIGLDGVTFRENFERRFWEASRASGDKTNLPECRRAAMRIMRRGWGLGALVAAGLILSNGALSASDAPVVHVKAVVKDGAVRLQAEANAPFEYTTYRPSESLYVVELSGVSAADPAGARVVASDLVKSYRLVPYSAGKKPMVRVEILLRQGRRSAARAQRQSGYRPCSCRERQRRRSSSPWHPTRRQRICRGQARCRSAEAIAATPSDTKTSASAFNRSNR